MSAPVLLSPLFIVVAGGLAIMLLDAFSKKRTDLASVTAMTLFVAGIVAAVALVSDAPIGPIPEQVSRFLALDKLGLFADVVICGGAGLSALLAGGYLREHAIERGEFYILLVFSAFGAMILAKSSDLLSLFVGLETMSLGVYSLVGFRRTSARATEGALKYFLLGSFASAILLFGSALLYGATGQTGFAEMGEVIAAGEGVQILVLVGMVLLLIGLLFKVSVVPFHMWTPDAYEGAITPATSFMSVAVKTAAVVILVRALLGVFAGELADPVSGWPSALAWLAGLTMVFGNVAAVMQSSVKRMLAYSSITHAGYIMVGLAASATVGSDAVSAVLFYLLAYTVSNVLAFGSLILMGSFGKEAVSYEDLAGVGRRHPLAAVPMILAMLTLMGFPPTAGFFAKYYVFSAAVQADMIPLAVVGVLASVAGASYYLKVLVYMFMKDPQEGAVEAVPMRSGYVAFALVLAGYFVLKIGITPSAYLDLAVSAARQFVG